MPVALEAREPPLTSGTHAPDQHESPLDGAIEHWIAVIRARMGALLGHGRALHAASLLIAGAIQLIVCRNQWFFSDEWDAIANRTSWSDVLRPHNEHPFIIPQIVYNVLLRTVGLHSYLPYIAIVVLLNLVLAHLLWVLLTRIGVSATVATVVTFLFAVFGAGFENLLWAFQISFFGSLVFGFAAVLLIRDRGPIQRADLGASVVLVLAWMCSGLGITLALFVGLVAGLRRRWSAAALLLVVPLGTYAVWAVIYPPTQGGPEVSLAASLRVFIPFALNGFIFAFSRILLVDGTGPVVLALVLMAVVATMGPRVGSRAPAIAGLAAGFVFLALAGLRRAGFGVEQSHSSRYVHVVICLAIPAIALAVDHVLRSRPLIVTGAVVLAVIVFAAQLDQLWREADGWSARSSVVRERVLDAAAEIRAGEEPDPDAPVQADWAPDLDYGELRWMIDQGWVPTN